MTEEAIDGLARQFRATGQANIAHLLEKLESLRRYQTDVPDASGIMVTVPELEALLGVAVAVKKVLELNVPTGVLLTQQWMGLIAASDRVTLDEPQPRPDEPDIDCPHSDEMLRGSFERRGVECSGCGAFASERRIFEETLLEDGSIPDTDDDGQVRHRRLSAIRAAMNQPLR